MGKNEKFTADFLKKAEYCENFANSQTHNIIRLFTDFSTLTVHSLFA